MALDKTITERWHNSEVLLLGGSAGSFKLLFRVVKILPPYFGKAVIVVMHRKKNFASEIEKLFAENSRMLLKEISDKDKINENTIYIAPANYHTLLEKEGYFSLDVSEAVWYSRPSIDVTFESAADTFNDRCTAILLSGGKPGRCAGHAETKKCRIAHYRAASR